MLSEGSLSIIVNLAETRKTGRDAETKAKDKQRYRAKRALKRKEAGITVKVRFTSEVLLMKGSSLNPLK